MKRPAEEFVEKAKLLTKDEVEFVFARMRGRFSSKLEKSRLDPLEAVALQLEHEDEQLREWRDRWAALSAQEEKKRLKKLAAK